MTETASMLLDALQAGALLALSLSYGADALARRDRLTIAVCAGCVAMGLRCGLGPLGALGFASAERLGGLLAALGCLALLDALWALFPAHLPRAAVATLGLLFLPGLVPLLGEPLAPALQRALQGWSLALYLATAVLGGQALVRARRGGDPLATRLAGGLLLALLPVAVELGARALFQARLGLGGLSIALLAVTLGRSWNGLIVQGLQERIVRTEEEASAWRGLVPGPTWHTREYSAVMEGLFGSGWESRLQDRMVGNDGLPYELHRRPLTGGGELGRVETEADTLPGTREFLQGWTVGLGMDDGEELDETRAWLESWGATVRVWGTVPPREGPYPSLLVWGREPSILQVWREDDLARRRSRWVQVGGAAVDGPHERIERPLDPGKLSLALQHLLNFGD